MKVGKDTVKSIIKTYGKASDAQISGDEMKLNYSGKDYGESVYLTFTKQYDGTFILSYASGRFPQDKVEVDKSYKADWTKNSLMLSIRGITLIHQTVQNLKMSLRITLKLQVQNTRFQHLVKVNSKRNDYFL